MSGTEAQRRNIRATVFALSGIATLVVALFVRQFIDPERLDPAWLGTHGAVLFDTPRAFDTPQLLDQDGAPFEARVFQGNWSVLFFGFTFCPDVCPTTLGLLREVEVALGVEAPLRYFLVSVDPARDTPAVLKSYIAHFSPRFTALTGEFVDVHRFATQLNVPFLKNVQGDGAYTIDHGANLVLINPQGHYAGYLRPPFARDRLVQFLKVLGGRTE